MTKTSTLSDVLHYAYNETSKNEGNQIFESILKDDMLADEFVEISEAQSLLDQCKYNASTSTLNKILEYSSSLIKESAK